MTKFTASRLYSSVKLRRVEPILNLPIDQGNYPPVSTKPGTVQTSMGHRYVVMVRLHEGDVQAYPKDATKLP